LNVEWAVQHQDDLHRAATRKESGRKDDVVSVTALNGYCLQVEFADGAKGTADLHRLIEEHPAYRALKDPAIFRSTFVHPELKSVSWAGDIDIAPETLRHPATGEPYPAWMEIDSPVR
jgi:hypothetical protein